MYNAYQTLLLVNTCDRKPKRNAFKTVAFLTRFHSLSIIFQWPFYEISFFMVLKLNKSQLLRQMHEVINLFQILSFE